MNDIEMTNIIGTNLLTKFHEDRKTNVASRVLTRKNAPPPGSHFHEDRTVNVASREKCPAPWKPFFFQANIIIFELIQDIIETNLLTKFHEDWTINVAPRVLTRKNDPPLFHDDRKINVTSRPRPCGGHVVQPTGIIFELVQDIIGMNLLTEFHGDRTINVASRVKNAPTLGGHVIQANVIIFELIQDIIKTNLLTIFHQDWTINVASRVLTRKNAPPPCGHVFQPTGIIFELVQDIIGMNLLTKKNIPPLGSHVFQAKTNLLSKFHEDRKINVASRVLTTKNAPPPGGHVFQPTSIIFELFHEDQTMNVASRVKNAPPLGSHANVDVAQRTKHDGQRTTDDVQKAITKAHHEHVVLR
ncbi:hypothetical protein DPMN_181881 [Dreissena polymorpha]|uniref:Uncharacterized protein n=1 Tax=Dreissena polymorpha TaxID=45954 RepID=A0A9D4DH16_DREPO|nr:hypothetical protein DPMN_181881 [Dreissena polymorpha]